MSEKNITKDREQASISGLAKGSHVHMMGICGTAMGSLAGILQEMGYRVTGSDQNIYPPMSTQLEALGISIMKGFVKENLSPKPDFVIVGNVMSRHMEEVQALLASEIPFSSLPKSLGELFLKDREAVVCCGTHGKTTTTSMMAWALETLEEHPAYLIGGVPANFKYSFSARDSKWFAIEGDEYDTAFFDKVPKFSHYFPKNAILTGVEFDHVDIYDDLSQVIDAFKILLHKIPDDGVLVYNGDDENIKKMLEDVHGEYWRLSYGLSDSCHAQVVEEEVTEEGTNVVFRVGDREYEFAGNWFGTYNSLNFLSVMALLDFKGCDLEKVIESAGTFKGVARRQEQMFQGENLVVFEDFAHHPSAVRLTLESFKKRYPEKNLIAVFEPRSATSRKDIFQKDYVKSFKMADVSIIAPVAKRSDLDVFSPEKLCKDLRGLSQDAICPGSIKEIPELIKSKFKGDDVVLFMSNGGFEGVHIDFVSKL